MPLPRRRATLSLTLKGSDHTMVALRHPLSGTLYEQIDDPPGAVRVVGKDGVADIAMCRWVANGLSTADRAATMAASAKAGLTRESEGQL
jgi:hypothetical protein